MSHYLIFRLVLLFRYYLAKKEKHEAKLDDCLVKITERELSILTAK